MSTLNSLIEPLALQQMLEHDPAGVRLIDVRSAGEFETVHIPGAYHVPLDSLSEHRSELRRLDGGVVVVCQTGGRARQAAQRLTAAGMTGVKVLDGGIDAWVRAGGSAARGRQRWSLERQVRLVAGLFVLGAVLASTVVPSLKWLAAGMGAGLTFAALTNTCAMGNLLARLPYNRGGAVCGTHDPRPSVTGAQIMGIRNRSSLDN